MKFRSEARDETRTIDLPRGTEVQGAWQEGEVSQSGRITAITAWHDGWVAVIESCITEIGLSLETRLWIAVDADHDRLTFRVDADGPERSWQRNLHLARGVLTELSNEVHALINAGERRIGTYLSAPTRRLSRRSLTCRRRKRTV